MPNTASTVPPFIPGLLIVSILIVISILVAWRNYVRRGNARLLPGVTEWPIWEPEAEGSRAAPEKPRMWEVDVRADDGEKHAVDENMWERIMPLSAASLTPEPPPPSDSGVSRHFMNSTPSASSRLSRLPFIGSSSLTTSSPPASRPPHQLQVSVLISMPSPQSTPRLSTGTVAHDTTSKESLPRQSTSSSIWKEKLPADMEEREGSAEVALGVAVLPWRKDEGRGVGHADSVT